MNCFKKSLRQFAISPALACLLLALPTAAAEEPAAQNLAGVDAVADSTPYSESADDVARHTVYGELFGPGLLYSLNYEYRFIEDASVRIGFGYIRAGASNEAGSVSGSLSFVPATLNYLGLRAGNHILELGAGVTGIYATVGAEAAILSVSESGLAALGVAQAGYRYQRTDGGLILRLGASALAGEGTRAVLPYLALGGAF